MNKRTKWVIAIVIAVVAVIIAIRMIGSRSSGAADAPRQNMPLVKTEKPVKQDVIYTLRYTGDIAAIQQANIFSKVSGNIEKILVDLGSSVRRNQLLAVIDSTELYQQYQQTAATFYNQKINYERTKQLYDQNLVAKQDLDNADAAMKVAQANFATAQTRLGYARITAPFNGYITKRFLDRGALVQPGSSTIFTIMKNDSVKVIVNVLEKDIPNIARGKQATIKVDAFPGKEFTGAITRVNQAIDMTTRTMETEIDIVNRDFLLKPGMYADVSIFVTKHPDAITIPTPALLNDDKGSYVYLLDSTRAKRAEVKPGLEQNARTEIISGLSGNEDVVTVGQQFLKDGIKVRLVSK
ncbi:MAG: efflux RND transporter periplasmic adaptor subunit [Ignavibacteriales bacterium]